MPSLAQLDQAVREFIAENPTDLVTVVVDASFGHRIDPSEVPAYEEAEVAGEVVSPPAGAIGRGDAFLLLIAEKTGATVLSNDSFQEFHGDHSWLFDKGRLIGGKPVPGVGWIFMDRTPVRGHKSREVVKEAKRRKRSEGDSASTRPPAEVTGLDLAAPKAKSRPKSVDRAIARATQEVVEPSGGSGRRRRRGSQPPADPVNEPLPFITFIAAHPLGSEVVGAASEYSSHGAFVEADGAKCYIPLSAMGDPPPRRAREVVTKGQPVTFVVQAFDPQRRGIELALPGFAHIAGGPTPETVDAEIHPDAVEKPRRRGRATKSGSAAAAAAAGAEPALAHSGATDGPAPGEAVAGDRGAARSGRGAASSGPKKPTGKPAVLSVAKPAPESGAEPEVADGEPAEKAKKAGKTKQQRPVPSKTGEAAEPEQSPEAAQPAKTGKAPTKRVRKTVTAAAPAPGAAPEGATPAPAGPEEAATTEVALDGPRTIGGEQPAPTTAPAKKARKARATKEAAPTPGVGTGRGSDGRGTGTATKAAAKAEGTPSRAPAPAKARATRSPVKRSQPPGEEAPVSPETAGGGSAGSGRKSIKAAGTPAASKAGATKKSSTRTGSRATSEGRVSTTDPGVPVPDSGVPVPDSGVPVPDSGVPVPDSGVTGPDSAAPGAGGAGGATSQAAASATNPSTGRRRAASSPS
jgi:S1 RNA binding domain